MSSNEENTFWVSYSDLSTGLMIVFMLVMLIMVMIQKQNTENQSERISEITSKLEIILGEKSKLADSINVAFKQDPTVQADPVTAQISIDEDALKFAENQAALQPESLVFLKGFTPKYLCALWQHEQQKCQEAGVKCDRLDPESPGGVRRIHITGHADMKGLYANNHQLSANRAEEVVQQMLLSLQNNPEIAGLPEMCQQQIGNLQTYAEERLWSVGAGETQHCTAELNDKDKGPYKGCDAIVGESNEHRKVDFRLEITGDDMTGLLADVVALRQEVGKSTDDGRLEKLSDTVADRCWKHPKSYHGCRVFARDCLVDPTKPNCSKMFENRKTDLGVYNMIKKICRSENLPGCEQ
jgi:outer membrane protein OmpA-like peptidoglycan-associated protein